MKVLVIHQQLPVPPMDGGRLRRLQQLRALAADHDVTLVGRCPDRAASEGFRRDHPDVRVVEVPEASDARASLVAQAVRALTARETFDCIHVSGLAQWPGARPLEGARVVVDIENYDTAVLRQRQAADGTTVTAFEVAATDALLRTVCGRADAVVACSEPDARQLRALAPEARVEIIPNGVDVTWFDGLAPPPRATPPVVLFTGLLAYWPNADACVHFAEAVLPRIERLAGPVAFQIVGRVPPASVVSLADGVRVRLAADVPDIRPWLAAADVLVVPLRAGSGTRLKILEGFAAGRPVVSTAIGCEGLDVEPGRHLLVADDPEVFASAVANLLADRTVADRLVAEARALVRARYAVPIVSGALRVLYRELAAA
jgi:glycosyltransferase involved in cell wall biosynthesis